MKSPTPCAITLVIICATSCAKPSDPDPVAPGSLMATVPPGLEEAIAFSQFSEKELLEEFAELDRLLERELRKHIKESVTPHPTLPPDAKQMRVHWKLKLPTLNRPEVDEVIRSEEAFTAVLAPHCQERHLKLYLQWNNIDFDSQMAILSSRTYPSGLGDHAIESVWETESEVIVVVRNILSTSSISLCMVTTPTSAIVVNRRDLPVRFEIYSPDPYEDAEAPEGAR